MSGTFSSRAVLLTAALLLAATPVAQADPNPKPHHMNLPKPTPAGGDDDPFVVLGSSSSSSAPTVAVIGDSVARDYAYYLGRELGPYGVRVVDAALSGCPAGMVQLIFRIHDEPKPLRGGACPMLVRRKQLATIRAYAPQVIVWHSLIEIRGLAGPHGELPAGTELWRDRITRAWDDTLARITTGGAKVVVILPLWYEHRPPARLDEPGGSAEKLRDLYQRWAARHPGKVTVVDVAPVVCPTGPPCGLVNGVDFRPDTTHFDDPGGVLVAAYLHRHVPALARLTAGRSRHR